MDQYLKQKLPIPEKTNGEEFLNREKEFGQQLKELIASKPQMVEDFQQPMVKDLSVEKIDRRGEIVPLKSAAEFKAQQNITSSAPKENIRKQAIKDLVYDAGAAKDEYYKKAASETGKKVFGTNSPVDLDYNQLRKAMKTGGKKLLGAVPILGGIANAVISGDASAAVPVLDSADAVGPAIGSLDDRIEKGTLTEADKQQLRLQALQKLR